LVDYRVHLDVFAGPLDLLLYLVRKEEVDIYDIPISRITEQYISYIEMLKKLDIEVAGDFLVMAATLMEIKSVMLLPKAEPEQIGGENLTDPRAELIRQLLEYKKFKDAANLLDAAAEKRQERFGRPDSLVTQLSDDAESQIDIEQVSIWNLLDAFDAICRATNVGADFRHIRDDTPIDLYQIEILHRLQTEGPMAFEHIFESRRERLAMIGMFLAMLELIRAKLVWAEQPAPFDQIYLKSLTDEPAEEAVRKSISAVAEVEADQPAPAAVEELPIPIAEIPAKAKIGAVPTVEPVEPAKPQAGN
jgi:segregation and condensation protein A